MRGLLVRGNVVRARHGAPSRSDAPNALFYRIVSSDVAVAALCALPALRAPQLQQ